MLSTKYRFLWIVVAAVLVPVILNFTIFQFSTPFTFKGDWLGFWANYSGALLGAAVAYFVANSQIEKQVKINQEEQKYNKVVNQLPALVRLKVENEKYIEELTRVEGQWIEILNAHNGIIKDPTEDEDAQGIEKTHLLEAYYPMEPADLGVDQYIEKIDDIDLHIRLIKAFNFYRGFYEAVTFDFQSVWSRVGDYVQDNTEEAAASIPGEIRDEIRLVMNKTEIYSKKKETVWDDLHDNNWIKEFNELLQCINAEIETIKRLREK